MAKSTGNLVLVDDLLRDSEPATIRVNVALESGSAAARFLIRTLALN